MEDSKLQFSCEIIAIVVNCKQEYMLSLVPRPHQLLVRKSGRGPGIFSHVSDVRIERMVERI